MISDMSIETFVKTLSWDEQDWEMRWECFASFGLKSQTDTHLSGVDAFTK